MRYIHNPNAKVKIPASAIVRIVFGGVCFLYCIIFAVAAVSGMGAPGIVFAVMAFIGAVLLILFGSLAIVKRKKRIRVLAPGETVVEDPNNPLFFTQCTSCMTAFNYEKTDLGYRFWYIDGYVPCPVCNRPIRHVVQKPMQYEYPPQQQYSQQQYSQQQYIGQPVQGQQYAQTNQVQTKQCPTCGAHIPSNSNFCQNCGQYVN